ncbi:penicillin-binding transpeptidase domain-containing protein [Streptomyces sp. VRA16 Mangrove soil]|uniref:penicillin-binding transpeptidase domain-containing protein n=1 Tax=Streptomyces sp. VRA16 Mangrove soil TaxID=2817434 RepID=UPI001A9CC432|nr:penicillin-binding transpeptidase domain-containing protein [Streptomyces sp. VRA16 Mangrove soil]MBO1330266.1 penicillin-binding protein [Streptomyces sp. VRA16 Mangrove soil]
MTHHSSTGRAPRSGRSPSSPFKAVTAVVVVGAVVAGGAWAAGLGPFDRGPGAPDPAAAAQARAFLSDWSRGRYEGAAARTTAPARAQEVLHSFTSGLDIEKPRLTASTVQRAGDGTVRVAFTARMPVTGLGTWTYTSHVPVREQGDGSWKVAWSLGLVHPHLSDQAKFRLERADPVVPKVTDRHGKSLVADAYPSLQPLLGGFAGVGGGPRGSIRLIDRVTGETERTETTFGRTGGAKGGATSGDAPVRTTLDASWQSAADRALAAEADGKNASLVALRVDNGEILAMANTPATGFNRAVSGTYAPGSTWKIVTSSALLLKKAVTPNTVVDCPRHLTVGKEFHNVETSEFRGATFQKDFTESCNTAFISLRDRLGDAESGDVARTYFGVGQEWHVGLPSYDGSVPVPEDATEKAAAMIGQGRVQANPLIMASVTATAASGRFHQPTIVPGAEDRTSTTPLPASVVTQLRTMMRATVTDGTARVLADLPGDIGAKTGTAEVAEGEPNNGWLVARRGNVAVACVVEQGVTGGGSAGPILHRLLSAVPGDPS